MTDFQSLPTELIRSIELLLSKKDLAEFRLTSTSFGSTALDCLFHTLNYQLGSASTLQALLAARPDLVSRVRQLNIYEGELPTVSDDSLSIHAAYRRAVEGLYDDIESTDPYMEAGFIATHKVMRRDRRLSNTVIRHALTIFQDQQSREDQELDDHYDRLGLPLAVEAIIRLPTIQKIVFLSPFDQVHGLQLMPFRQGNVAEGIIPRLCMNSPSSNNHLIADTRVHKMYERLYGTLLAIEREEPLSLQFGSKDGIGCDFHASQLVLPLIFGEADLGKNFRAIEVNYNLGDRVRQLDFFPDLRIEAGAIVRLQELTIRYYTCDTLPQRNIQSGIIVPFDFVQHLPTKIQDWCPPLCTFPKLQTVTLSMDIDIVELKKFLKKHKRTLNELTIECTRLSLGKTIEDLAEVLKPRVEKSQKLYQDALLAVRSTHFPSQEMLTLAISSLPKALKVEVECVYCWYLTRAENGYECKWTRPLDDVCIKDAFNRHINCQ
ncbi:MAG: hypothetical protein M1814_000495 [Vezdaea aestivalis]|nr:MAG: hypothetical protein M1814_000495 [Vezdaea aestivalis]